MDFIQLSALHLFALLWKIFVSYVAQISQILIDWLLYLVWLLCPHDNSVCVVESGHDPRHQLFVPEIQSLPIIFIKPSENFNKNNLNFVLHCIFTWSVPSHYLKNQCWNIVNCTLRNKLQWNFNRNLKIFIHENAFEMSSAKSQNFFYWPQCVNSCYGSLAAFSNMKVIQSV